MPGSSARPEPRKWLKRARPQGGWCGVIVLAGVAAGWGAAVLTIKELL